MDAVAIEVAKMEFAGQPCHKPTSNFVIFSFVRRDSKSCFDMAEIRTNRRIHLLGLNHSEVFAVFSISFNSGKGRSTGFVIEMNGAASAIEINVCLMVRAIVPVEQIVELNTGIAEFSLWHLHSHKPARDCHIVPNAVGQPCVTHKRLIPSHYANSTLIGNWMCGQAEWKQ